MECGILGTRIAFNLPMILGSTDAIEQDTRVKDSYVTLNHISPPRRGQEPTGQKILIADDQKLNRRLLCRLLERNCYVTIEAGHGEETLEIVERERPHLVLLDVIMPGLNGFDVCARIKERQEFQNLPVIFLSAAAEVEDKVHGLEVGGSDYIAKPFDSSEVLARVRTHLKIRHLNESLQEAYFDLSEKQKQIENDLRAAAQIQHSLLPAELPALEAVQFATFFEPCETVGGDLYHVHRINEDTIGGYLLDVSGHGVPSAMVTASVAQVLQPHTGLLQKLQSQHGRNKPVSPVEVLLQLEENFPFERFHRFFTMFYFLLELESGTFRYCNAGHPPGILVSRTGETKTLPASGTIVGLGGTVPFEEGRIALEPGDRIILYTDGIIEHSQNSGGDYGITNLTSFWQDYAREPLSDAVSQLIEDVSNFGDGRFKDDVSLLAIEYTG